MKAIPKLSSLIIWYTYIPSNVGTQSYSSVSLHNKFFNIVAFCSIAIQLSNINRRRLRLFDHWLHFILMCELSIDVQRSIADVIWSFSLVFITNKRGHNTPKIIRSSISANYFHTSFVAKKWEKKQLWPIHTHIMSNKENLNGK